MHSKSICFHSSNFWYLNHYILIWEKPTTCLCFFRSCQGSSHLAQWHSYMTVTPAYYIFNLFLFSWLVDRSFITSYEYCCFHWQCMCKTGADVWLHTQHVSAYIHCLKLVNLITLTSGDVVASMSEPIDLSWYCYVLIEQWQTWWQCLFWTCWSNRVVPLVVEAVGSAS